jgi:hypothetical protein
VGTGCVLFCTIFCAGSNGASTDAG